jgi:hypothetical protein
VVQGCCVHTCVGGLFDANAGPTWTAAGLFDAAAGPAWTALHPICTAATLLVLWRLGLPRRCKAALEHGMVLVWSVQGGAMYLSCGDR